MVELSLGGPSPQDPEITRIALIAVRGGDESAFRQLWDASAAASMRPSVNILTRISTTSSKTLA
jgi:hypothetical protein